MKPVARASVAAVLESGSGDTVQLDQGVHNHALDTDPTHSRIPDLRHCALFLLIAPAPAQTGKSVDEILSAVVRVQTEINPAGRTAPALGTTRDGHGVVIDSSGLVLTIGYLILES